MILKSSDHIANLIGELGISAVELAPSVRSRLLESLREALGVDVTRTPWDDASGPGGVRRPDGWSLISRFVGHEGCVLIPDEVDRIWVFRDGGELHKLLGETAGFEFYVCDPKATWLLCHNDHDCLIGWGAAKDWVASLLNDPASFEKPS